MVGKSKGSQRGGNEWQPHRLARRVVLALNQRESYARRTRGSGAPPGSFALEARPGTPRLSFALLVLARQVRSRRRQETD